MRPRGFTLMEALVTLGILGLLLTTIFAIFRLSTQAWRKGLVQTELLQELQVASARLGREAEGSVYSGLTISPDGKAAAILSAAYGEGLAVDSITGDILWQNYAVFYHNSADNTIRWRRVPFVASDPSSPDNIENSTGSPLASHLHDGRVLARNVVDCTMEIYADSILTVTLRAEKPRLRDDVLEKNSIRTAIKLRN